MKFKKVALGGTFDILHEGHRSLIRKAFEVGGEVVIGLTTDEFAARIKSREVNSFKERMEKLIEFIRREFPNRKFKIIALKDTYGPTIYDNEIDALVVSEEKVREAVEINRIRVEKGLKPMEIIILPLIRAKNGSKISSEAIRKGLMNDKGDLSSK